MLETFSCRANYPFPSFLSTESYGEILDCGLAPVGKKHISESSQEPSKGHGSLLWNNAEGFHQQFDQQEDQVINEKLEIQRVHLHAPF